MDLELEPPGTVWSAVGVRDVPEDVRTLSTFAHPDYVDLFSVRTPRATHRSAEQWARAILEEAPLSRRSARRLWTLLGLRLGPRGSPDYVQGWRIAARGCNWVRAETSSWYMSAQALCLVEEGRVSVSLCLRYDRPLVAAPVWAMISDSHRRALPVMLRQAVKLTAA